MTTAPFFFFFVHSLDTSHFVCVTYREGLGETQVGKLNDTGNPFHPVSTTTGKVADVVLLGH